MPAEMDQETIADSPAPDTELSDDTVISEPSTSDNKPLREPSTRVMVCVDEN